MLSKSKSERGAVTIEATLSLTAFMFMFIMIYSIITICRAQAHIQVAINNTAKEISQYSYIYGLTGIDSSMQDFYKGASVEQENVNGFISNVGDTFNSIQTGLSDAGSSIIEGDLNSLISTLETTGQDVLNGSADALQQLESASENPQNLMLGMAKIIGANTLDLAKSKLVAQPISRALVKKHLKRYESDTADKFCKSVGIVPDTYFGSKSYFNGLDFSNSTLFPFGSDEITVVVTYKVKMIQLLPIDLEFKITQRAVTKGWLHGDKQPSNQSAEKQIEMLKQKGDSIWNCATPSERNNLARSMALTDLKANGYYGISGDSSIHAYDTESNTFVYIVSYNPLENLKSMDEIKPEVIKDKLSRYASTIHTSTDTRHSINIKKVDKDGHTTISEVNCDSKKNNKVILVIPEDEGLKEIFEEQIKALGSDVEFDIVQKYGTIFE